MTDPDVLADQVLPLDGPHTADSIVAGTELLAQLVRRLNHAVRDTDLDDPRDVHRVFADLHLTARGLTLLCDLLAIDVGALDRPDVYASSGAPTAAAVAEAASAMSAAGQCAATVTGHLKAGRDATARLGIHEPDTERE